MDIFKGLIIWGGLYSFIILVVFKSFKIVLLINFEWFNVDLLFWEVNVGGICRKGKW